MPAPSEIPPRRAGLLREPIYGYGDSVPRRPSFAEICSEWSDAINFFKDPSRLLPAIYLLHHAVTGIVFFFFFTHYVTIWSILGVLAAASFIGTVYNTLWYHRYCSHQAFKFRSLLWPRLLLWTNPAFFREESYVIPHRIHHSKSDEPGDPYGPHLGWLGSYLATESSQRTNRDLSPKEYDRLVKTLTHIGFKTNTHADFRRTGSVEAVWHYAVRMLVANGFWTALTWYLGGLTGVLGWYAGVFLYTFLVRDFNYRGHGGFFFKASKGLPANQIFYGFIAGEWHDNHHAHPRLARSGLKWWQLDLPFLIIKLLQFLGIVTEVTELIDDGASALPERATSV